MLSLSFVFYYHSSSEELETRWAPLPICLTPLPLVVMVVVVVVFVIVGFVERGTPLPTPFRNGFVSRATEGRTPLPIPLKDGVATPMFREHGVLVDAKSLGIGGRICVSCPPCKGLSDLP